MQILNQRAIEASDKERPTPDIRTGDIVEIKLVFFFSLKKKIKIISRLCWVESYGCLFFSYWQEVPENKRRLSIYKGIVMSKQNAGIHTTIRIRRIIAGVGVEIVFPV